VIRRARLGRRPRQPSGSCRLLAPLFRQRLPSGMGCTGAPIIEVLRDAGPFDGFCLTSAACPECVKSHGTEPQARIASCALCRPTLLSDMLTANFSNHLQKLRQLGDIFTAIRRASPRKRTSRRHRECLPQRETMAKFCDSIALDRLRHIGGGQFRRLKTYKHLPALRAARLRFINPNASANELKTTPMSHSIIHGDAYFATSTKSGASPKETM
jgi:hypothetical protein